MVRGRLVVALFAAAVAMGAAPAPMLTEDGLGALRIGMTKAAAERAIGHPIRLDATSSDDLKVCALGDISAMPNVYLLLEGFRIHVIAIGKQIATVDGVRTGSSEDDLRRIFGARAVFGPRPYFDDDPTAHSVIVKLHGRREFLFQTEHGKVTNISVGDRPAVEYWEGCV